MKRDTRVPEVDGRRYLHNGAEFVDSLDAQITSTLIETTAQNFINLLGSAAVDIDNSTSTKTIVKVNTAIDKATDYANNIVWIGDTADGRLVAIEFSNALNTADLAFTFQDKNEGKLPFEFHAHQNNVRAYDTAPAALYFFEGADDVSLYYATGVAANFTAGSLYSGTRLPAGVYDVAFYSENGLSALSKTYVDNLTIRGDSNHDDAVITEADHIGNGIFKKTVYLDGQFGAAFTMKLTPDSDSLSHRESMNMQNLQFYPSPIPQSPSNSVTPQTGITLTGFGGTLAATTAPELYQGACTLTKSGSEPDQMALKVSAPAWDSFAVHKSGSNNTWTPVPYDQKNGVVFSWGGTATQTENYRVTVTRGTGEDVEMEFFLITVTFTYSTSV